MNSRERALRAMSHRPSTGVASVRSTPPGRTVGQVRDGNHFYNPYYEDAPSTSNNDPRGDGSDCAIVGASLPRLPTPVDENGLIVNESA